MLGLLINLVIWVVVLAILWKLIQLVLAAFGIPVSPQIMQLIGFLFLLIVLVQLLSFSGVSGLPAYHFYRY